MKIKSNQQLLSKLHIIKNVGGIMKKSNYILLVIMFASIILSACGQEDKMNNSEIFEEEFFEDIVSVSMIFRDRVLTDDKEINQILNVLADVENIQAEENMEDIYGSFSLEFNYKNGDKRIVIFTGQLIYYNGVTYTFDEEGYNTINNLFLE